MDLGLEGQVVLVTGASKGIGFACAEAFAREGAKVALVSRSRANLDAALARITGVKNAPVAFDADMIDAAQAARVVDETLIDRARALTGLSEKTAVVHEGLRALIARESGRRLAALGGKARQAWAPPRRRPVRRRPRSRAR